MDFFFFFFLECCNVSQYGINTVSSQQDFTCNVEVKELGIICCIADIFSRIVQSTGKDLESTIRAFGLEFDVLALLKLLPVFVPGNGSIGPRQLTAQYNLFRDMTLKMDIFLGMYYHHWWLFRTNDVK